MADMYFSYVGILALISCQFIDSMYIRMYICTHVVESIKNQYMYVHEFTVTTYVNDSLYGSLATIHVLRTDFRTALCVNTLWLHLLLPLNLVAHYCEY